MGNNCCQEKRIKRPRIALLLVGLDNAGKTVTAKGLAGERLTSPIPTIGFSVVDLKYSRYDVKIFDLGGSPNIRGIWHKYFVDVHGIIFVLDACDTERFQEVRNSLETILSHEKITGKPLLILANKQDKENALDEIDVIECLEIEALANKYKCPTLVQSCCANETNYNKIDQGVKAGYEWLVSYITRNYGKLNIRVQMDVVDQGIKEKEEMLEKIKKIRAERDAIEKAQDPDAIETYSEYETKLNGEVVKALDIKDFYSSFENSNSESTTSDSSITFPTVYHITSYGAAEYERPKSAVQIVRHQLQLNNDAKRSNSLRTKRCKTAPIHLYGSKHFCPSSTRETSHKVTLVRPAQRNLKSAGDSVFKTNKMGPGGDYHHSANYRREIFEIEGKELPPLRMRSKVQVVNHQGERNGISVVDVE